jgi:hypothetical protein
MHKLQQKKVLERRPGENRFLLFKKKKKEKSRGEQKIMI